MSAEEHRVVVVYERVSSQKQDLERQKVQRERAAKAHPDAPQHVIQEKGTAWKRTIFDRPGGAELCALIESGQVEAVHADEQNRLSRGKQLEWWTFADLCERNGTRIFIDGRELELEGTGEDEIKSGIDQYMARRYSAELSRRVKGGKKRNALKGRPNGGPRRFGFEPQEGKTGVLVKRPEEVAVAERIMRELVVGKSQTRIAEGLNDDAIPPALGHKLGNRWRQSQVSQLLRDPIWGGKLRNAEGLFDATFDPPGPPVPPELWEAVQATLDGPAGPRRGRPSRRFLLSGLLRCSCGELMTPKPIGGPYPRDVYRCPGRVNGQHPECRQKTVRRERIDLAVLDYFTMTTADVDRMVEERRRARADKLADLTVRAENARRALETAERKLARLDVRASEDEEFATEDYRRAAAGPKQELAAAAGALEDLGRKRAEAEAEPDLGDAEEDTLERLAELRALVAGEVSGTPDDIARTRAALQRLFACFVLRQERPGLDDPRLPGVLPTRIRTTSSRSSAAIWSSSRVRAIRLYRRRAD